MKHENISKKQAEAAGFTVDTCCYPWVAYKGPRFNPTKAFFILTDKEYEAWAKEHPTTIHEFDAAATEQKVIESYAYDIPVTKLSDDALLEGIRYHVARINHHDRMIKRSSEAAVVHKERINQLRAEHKKRNSITPQLGDIWLYTPSNRYCFIIKTEEGLHRCYAVSESNPAGTSSSYPVSRHMIHNENYWKLIFRNGRPYEGSKS